MSISPCSFSTVADLFVQAITNGLNITALAISCPTICSLAWGNGNPDVSGIGLHISYIIQVVLTFICGPFFFLIYILYHFGYIDETTTSNTLSIHDTFLDTSVILNTPIAIAAIIRAQQPIPFYEVAFLQLLIFMQATTLLPVTVIVGVFEGPHRRSAERVAVITIYLLLAWGLSSIPLGLARGNANTRELGKELVNSCKSYSGISSISHTILDQLSLYETHRAEHITALLSFLVALLFLVLRNWRRYRKVVTGILVLLFTGMPFLVVVRMQHARIGMKEILGNDFQDDQWGFGQIIAVFIWVPLCARMLLNLVHVFTLLFFPVFTFINIWYESNVRLRFRANRFQLQGMSAVRLPRFRSQYLPNRRQIGFSLVGSADQARHEIELDEIR